jgi:hypothetical protein
MPNQALQTRVDHINSLFDELQRELGFLATRNCNTNADQIKMVQARVGMCRREYDGLIPNLKSRNDELTLRMLGDNIKLQRWQWEELLESVVSDSELSHRILMMLEAHNG